MDSCVEWDGYRNANGYGRLYLRGERRYILAHRWAWEQANGPIPDALRILHLCDNPPCVNLEHLRLGTQEENWADMRAKGRLNRPSLTQTHCKHGHPFDEANTRWGVREGWQTRQCRACCRENTRVYRERLAREESLRY